MPTIALNDAEHAAVAAAIRSAIETDRFPRAPRLDPLRAALGKFEAAREPTTPPKAPTVAKADKAPAPKISPGFKLGRLSVRAPCCRSIFASQSPERWAAPLHLGRARRPGGFGR